MAWTGTFSRLLIALAAMPMLAGCDPKAANIFTAENRFGAAIPEGARQVSPEEFAKAVADGKFKLVGEATRVETRRKREADLAADRATAAAIPEDMRSGELIALMRRVEKAKDPFAEPIRQVRQADGTTRPVTLLSPAASLHQMLSARAQSRTAVNALSAYRMALAVAPAGAAEGLPSAASLASATIEQINVARDRLDMALGEESGLDRVTLSPAPETAAQPREGGASGDEPISKTATPGADGPAAGCPHAANGVYANFFWPLKRFVSPPKDQGHRGACWTFAAVGALESARQVNDDVSPDLSEQNFFYMTKIDTEDTSDGDSAEGALALHAKADPKMVYADEGQWRYNPSIERTGEDDPVYGKACGGYGGLCSNTIHQSPMLCTLEIALGGPTSAEPFCAAEKRNLSGASGTVPVGTTNVWTSGDKLPVATLRNYLAGGQVLIATFGVYNGFGDVNDRGLIEDYSKEGGGDGHVVQIVGYISNADKEARLSDIAEAGGGGYFILKNSWGCSGDGGYYLIPAQYMSDVFWDLSVLNIPATRGTRWKTEQGAPKGGPSLTVSQPFAMTGGTVMLAPRYVDFSQPITFAARADDGIDGADCCKTSYVWTSQKQGVIGNAPQITATLIGPSDTVTVTTRDADGNSASIALMLADDTPVVTITKPVENAMVPYAEDVAVAATVRTKSGKLLDCSKLIWTTMTTGAKPKPGCTSVVSLFKNGTNNVTAIYVYGDNKQATATVSVRVLQLGTKGKPYVSLNIARHNDQSTESNAVAVLSVNDPGGPGDADLSKYKFAWAVEYQGVRKPIAPAAFLGRANSALIVPSKVLSFPQCAANASQQQPTVKVYLTVTDPEGLSDETFTSYRFVILPCVR